MSRVNTHINKIFLIGIIVLGLFTGHLYPESNDSLVIDWSNPISIDPFQPGIADFLNDNWQNFSQTGLNYLLNGQYQQAASYLLAALHYNGDDVIALYNLSCAYSKLGSIELAVHYLQKAFDNGYSDLVYALSDTDFAQFQFENDFVNCMEDQETAIRNTGKIVYIEGSKLIPCRVHLPAGYDPQKKYPLLIGLHGYTGNAESMSRLWRLFKKQNFIYVCPEGLYTITDQTPQTEGRYSWELPNTSPTLWKRADVLPIAYINNVRNYICSVFSVDKVFLFGFSQGAGYAYTTSIKNPEKYAGVICFGGSLPISDKPTSLLTESEINKAKNLPVFIGHGMNDKTVSFKAGEKSRDYLQDHGYDVTFKDFVAGHIIETTVLRNAEKWMMSIASK